MQDVVLQMMTTLNGRVDDPDAWLTGVADDQYAEINRAYDGFDTVLVGRVTYEEMAAYWPGAEHESGGSEENRTMARRMNRYRKFVFSGQTADSPLAWNNSELVPVNSDHEIVDFVANLKRQPGKDIILTGGARLAQTFVRLKLVDRFHLYIYPSISEGKTLFELGVERIDLQLTESTTFENGVVGLFYARASGEPGT